jgi:predicted nucleic acid-binding protein
MPEAGNVIFVDTNIYFYAHDEREPAKQAVCREWLLALGQHRLGRVNLQVADEFTAVVFRKRRDIQPELIFRLADEIMAWGAAPISSGTIQGARHIWRQAGYSWWDCLLLASALELGCTHFLSENLQDGQQLEGLTIVDPFAHSAQQIISSL